MMYMTFILIGLVSVPLLAPELTPPIPDIADPREQEVETETDFEPVLIDLSYSRLALLSQGP